jgi:stage III sporulation protein SpoIIIAA
MFGLLHGLYHHVFAKTELNIIILGLDNAGKT